LNSLPMTTATAATLFAASLAHGQVTAEVEPNQSKATATAVSAPMQPGDTLTGTTTGSSSSAGSASLDYFRVQTAVAPAGIYRYRLVITTSGTEGHVGSIRGTGQNSTGLGPWLPAELVGAPTTSDSLIQVTSTTTTPARFNQWYGFGKGEQVFYRVAGVGGKAATSAPYTVTLERQAVTSTNIGTLPPGVLTIKTVGEGHTTDTELWIYDSEFNAISGYGNDDESAAVHSGIPGLLGTTTQSALRREFAPGIYYVAVSNFGLSNNQPSPSDDDFRSGNLLDFADVIATASPSTGLDLTFSVSNGATTITVPNTKAGAYDINFFEFTVAVPPPVNDECAGAFVIGDETLAFDNTNATASAEPLPAECDGGLGTTMARDVWFVYEASCTGEAVASTCGTTSIDSRLAVYDADCPPVGAIIGCNNDSTDCTDGGARVTFPVVAGESYLIRVGSSAAGGGIGSLSVTCTPVVLPPNDECADAAVIGNETLGFNNTDATASAEPLPASCDGGLGTAMEKDLWFVYEATCSGEVVVSTCGTKAFDARLAVYAADCPPAGALVACNNDSPDCTNGGARVAFEALAGEFYLIRVGSSSDVGGVGTLTVSCTPVVLPPNDECAGAIAIGNETLAFDNTDATASSTALPASCDGGLGTTMANDVWYVYEATCSGEVTISTCGSGAAGARLAIYDGDCPSAGVLAGCDNNSAGCAGGGASVTVDAVAGQFFLIRVGSSGGAGGAGSLTVGCTTVAECPADLNSDGQVNAQDIAILLGNFGGTGVGDINADGAVGAQDLAALLSAFGPCAAAVPCPADLNGDGQVNAEDLAILLSNFGGTGVGDINGDGAVGAQDLAALLNAFGPCP
jgi:hypothetical protein